MRNAIPLTVKEQFIAWRCELNNKWSYKDGTVLRTAFEIRHIIAVRRSHHFHASTIQFIQKEICAECFRYVSNFR